METENRLASLNESAPLRCHCQPGLGAVQRRSPRSPRPSGPFTAESQPRRVNGGSAVGARAGPGVTQGFRHRSREPRGGRCISMARGASPFGWSPGPGRSGRSARPESSQGRPASGSSTSSLVFGPQPPLVPLRIAALGPTAAQPRVCVQSRRAAVCSGAGHRGACEPVRVCGCGSVGWPRRPQTLHPGYVQ